MIIFLRHAQAENNAKRILAGRTEGVHLTKTGIEQAEQIAKYLKPLDISAIYSSPIERASHTAKIVPLMFPYASFARLKYSFAAVAARSASREPISISCFLHHLNANPLPIPPVPPIIPIFMQSF